MLMKWGQPAKELGHGSIRRSRRCWKASFLNVFPRTRKFQPMPSDIAVLVIEDEALIRMDVAYQLRDEGFKIYEADDASEAIALLERHSDIRLIFTDVDMPGSMDGLALAAAVRDRWPPVRIIVTSGHRIIDIADLPDGSVFFSKPYRHAEIVKSMRELLA